MFFGLLGRAFSFWAVGDDAGEIQQMPLR